MIKIGIISFAHMHAYSYANALKGMKDVQLAGVADDDGERGRKAADRFQTTFYSSYEELLKQDIDAVIITSENVHHCKHVVAAAEAKINILCEKPLATRIEDAEEMIHACEKNNAMLQVAFPVRFNSSILRAKHFVDSGKLGRVLAMRGTNRGTNPGGWFVDRSKSGGGAVIDHTVHVVDIMRWFMKAEVSEVYAEVDQFFSEGSIDDAGILTMEFNNGVFATLDCSWSRNKTFPTWGDVTLEIVGTNGTLHVDAFGQNLHVYSNQHGVRRNFWGDDMDDALIRDFVKNVTEKTAPSIAGTDGLRTLEVALAAYRSAEKKQPVSIG